MPILRILLSCLLLGAACLHAADGDETLLGQLRDLAAGDEDQRKAALDAIVAADDGRAADAIEAWFQGSFYLFQDQAAIGEDVDVDVPERTGPDGEVIAASTAKGLLLRHPLTREPLAEPLMADLPTPTECGRKEKRLANAALTVLRLADPDDAKRLIAVTKAGDNGDAKTREVLVRRLEREANAKIRRVTQESIALIDLATATEDAPRLAAAEALADLGSARGAARLRAYAEANREQLSPELSAAITAALARIDNWQSIARGFGHVFSGLSLGSILIIMALGLSIIFGLMGVINMAHGEMMMIGAYTMFAVQQLIGRFCPPGLMEFSLLISLPLSFLAAGVVGWVVEATVIRWLYGRPLDTLLATVGVSYVLVQGVRLIAGNNNAIQAPTWLTGGWEVLPDVILPFNRIFILSLCIGIVVAMHLLINRSKMGLLLRATTQNRMMAQALGVRTRRVDGLTFALGCGIAGIAGCALTLTDILKPDMGSTYIIESFMVVTAGGVGKLAGAIVAGLGLGFFNKALEPIFQAVWAKVWMLLAVIILLQWRPSGLFPAKGRLADV